MKTSVGKAVFRYLIRVTVGKKTGKMKYGGFSWEIQGKHLKKFPVIFDYDDDYNFLGLTIFKGAKGKS